MRSQVQDFMMREVKTIRASESAERAAQLMWDHDVGCVPVIDDKGLLAGMITDRDICMAAYTQGRNLREILVVSAMAQHPIAVRPEDEIEVAEELMRRHQVRRLPVVDAGREVVGIIALNDLVRCVSTSKSGAGEKDVLDTLRAVGWPRHSTTMTESAAHALAEPQPALSKPGRKSPPARA